MLKTCSHTFCSSCIHHWLTFQNTCPSCGNEAKENDLVYNRIVDDIVKHFHRIRLKLLGPLKSLEKENDPNVSQENIDSKNRESPDNKVIGVNTRNSVKKSLDKGRESDRKFASPLLTKRNEFTEKFRVKREKRAFESPCLSNKRKTPRSESKLLSKVSKLRRNSDIICMSELESKRHLSWSVDRLRKRPLLRDIPNKRFAGDEISNGKAIKKCLNTSHTSKDLVATSPPGLRRSQRSTLGDITKSQKSGKQEETISKQSMIEQVNEKRRINLESKARRRLSVNERNSPKDRSNKISEDLSVENNRRLSGRLKKTEPYEDSTLKEGTCSVTEYDKEESYDQYSNRSTPVLIKNAKVGQQKPQLEYLTQSSDTILIKSKYLGQEIVHSTPDSSLNGPDKEKVRQQCEFENTDPDNALLNNKNETDLCIKHTTDTTEHTASNIQDATNTEDTVPENLAVVGKIETTCTVINIETSQEHCIHSAHSTEDSQKREVIQRSQDIFDFSGDNDFTEEEEDIDTEDLLKDINQSIDEFDLEAVADLSTVSNSFQSEYRDIWPALSQIFSPEQQPSMLLDSSIRNRKRKWRHVSGESYTGSDVSVCSEMSDVIPSLHFGKKTIELELPVSKNIDRQFQCSTTYEEDSCSLEDKSEVRLRRRCQTVTRSRRLKTSKTLASMSAKRQK